MSANGQDADTRDANWLATAARQSATAAIADLGRMATTIYTTALGEGLDAGEAKDIVEAVMTSMLRAAREMNAE